jgi:hypothetical protein
MFEAEAHREGRLALFRSNELSIAMSKMYLKEKFGYDCTDESVLKKFPRGFDQLKRFGEAADKEAFTNKALKRQVQLIVESETAFPPRTWFQWISGVSSKGVTALLRRALKQDIGIAEIVDIGGMSKAAFINAFVDTNIFRPTNEGKFSLQFDVTRIAVKQVVGESNRWFAA